MPAKIVQIGKDLQIDFRNDWKQWDTVIFGCNMYVNDSYQGTYTKLWELSPQIEQDFLVAPGQRKLFLLYGHEMSKIVGVGESFFIVGFAVSPDTGAVKGGADYSNKITWREFNLPIEAFLPSVSFPFVPLLPRLLAYQLPTLRI